MTKTETFDDATIDIEGLEKNFAILSRQLLQDPDISADAQMVATFLLSLPKYKKDGKPWQINPTHIWNSKNIGRDRVYKAIKELCELGYMKREVEKKGNLKGKTTYFISNLKKFFRLPGSQDTESRDTESQGLNKKEAKKKELKEKTNNRPPSPHEPPPLHDMNPPPSSDEGKEEPLNKNKIKKNNKPEAPASDSATSSVVCSFDNLLEKTPLTVPQQKQIKTLFGHLDSNVFKNAISAYLAYAEKNEVDDHFATVRSALGGKNGVPWVVKKTDAHRESENRKKTYDAFGKFDNRTLGDSIKWNVVITSRYIEFACGSNGNIFEYKSKVFEKTINEFLERAQIDIRI